MFYVVANNAGLDLVNTRGFQGGRPVDLMTSFADLINWAAAAGIIDEMRARPRTESLLVPRTGHVPMLMDDSQVGPIRRFLLK